MITFSSIWNKLKEMIGKMLSKRTIEQTLYVTPAISSKMVNAIDLWSAMYEGESPWLHEPTYDDPTLIISMGLPQLIASEKARMALIEFKSEITVPTTEEVQNNPDYEEPQIDEFGNVKYSTQPKTITVDVPVGDDERAKWLNEQYKKVLDRLRPNLEYGIAKGGLVIKPYVILTDVIENGEATGKQKPIIEFDFIQADAFFPLAFDGGGKVTEAAFIQRKMDKDTIYSRLEYHKIEGSTITIQNRAFKSKNTTPSQFSALSSDTDLGQEISLKEVPEWSNLTPEQKIDNVDRLLFGYFKMPDANTIDPHSPLGVSGYSRAVKLIREADKQYSRMLWEFEGGELAIDIDRDALTPTKDANGEIHQVMGSLQKRLYRPIDLGESNTYQPYAPALRDGSLVNGLNVMLMRIEDICAISRGTLSDVSTEAKTATELKILKQRSYASNLEIQKQLELTLRDLVYIMDVYCTLYDIVPAGAFEASFEWDDSILVDVNEELNKRLTLMQNGLVSKEEVRSWYFGETMRQAQEALQKIAGDNAMEAEQNMAQFMNQNNMNMRNSQRANQQKTEEMQKQADIKTKEAKAKSDIKIKEKEALNKLK